LEIINNPRPGGDFKLVNFRDISDGLRVEIIKAFEDEMGITEHEVILMGRNWFPENGYMGWHDDNRYPGYRLYCVYAEEDNKCFFRYKDIESGKIITSWEKKGWNFRIFDILPENPLWHCVYAGCNRVSIGHRFVV